MSSLAILISHSWGYGQSELCYGAEQNSGAVFAGLSSIALVGFHFVINTSPYRLINSSVIATALISPFPWWLQRAFPLGAMYTVSFQDFIHFLSCFSTTRERGHRSTPGKGRSVVWPIFLNGSRAVIPPGGNTYQLYANWLGQYGARGCQEVLNCCSYTVWMCCTEMKQCLYFFFPRCQGKDNYTAAKRCERKSKGLHAKHVLQLNTFCLIFPLWLPLSQDGCVEFWITEVISKQIELPWNWTLNAE